jgi:hypothetical protein
MKKIIIIFLCLLFIAAGLPLFAHGKGDDRGRFSKDNPQRWQGSTTHPAFHGHRGWGKAPSHAPAGIPAEEPANPPTDPQEDPGDKPGQEPGEKPGDKDGDVPMGGMWILNLFNGSFPG